MPFSNYWKRLPALAELLLCSGVALGADDFGAADGHSPMFTGNVRSEVQDSSAEIQNEKQIGFLLQSTHSSLSTSNFQANKASINMFEDTGRFHRVPVGFGPAASPRQGPDGKPFSWAESQANLTGIVYNVSRTSLQALLPEGYEVDSAVQPTVLFEVMELRNLPWLAGRGYNTWGVYANDIICHRATEGAIKGSYMLVLFESFTDPITTGREELGFSKLWAELPDFKIEAGMAIHTASWFGYEFMRMEIPNVVERSVEEAPSMFPRPYTMPSTLGTLHQRYVPAVGDAGKHDACYATFMPGAGDRKPPVIKYLTTAAPLAQSTIKITEGTFEQIPTLWSVIKGLASLELGEVREVARQELLGGGHDCSTNRRVEF